jgi:hypothetical protein
METAPALFTGDQSVDIEKLTLFRSVLFRRSAQVEMQAASVLFSSVQAF